jgi:hypothetical protein
VRVPIEEAVDFESDNPRPDFQSKPPTQVVAPPSFEAFSSGIAPEIKLPKSAMILCRDPLFQRWVESLDSWDSEMYTDSLVCAAHYVYATLFPKAKDTPPELTDRLWREMIDAFSLWGVRN